MFEKLFHAKPVHVPGTHKGEETVMRQGREPGRDEKNPRGYRSARDSTGINARHMDPIDRRMPSMPPA